MLDPPDDVLLLSRLARQLDTTFTELAAGLELRPTVPDQGDESEYFFVVCPNPLCPKNKREQRNGASYVSWTSYDGFPFFEFSEINYCGSCGTELIKECPSCRRRLGKKQTRYCTKCGQQLIKSPTDEQWEEIRKMLQSQKPEVAPSNSREEIPF
jgi:hypothetical protein